MKEGIIKLRESRIIEPEEMREREYGKGEEGRTLTRESKSEFTPRGRDLPTFPLLGCLVLGCNRQAQRNTTALNEMKYKSLGEIGCLYLLRLNLMKSLLPS